MFSLIKKEWKVLFVSPVATVSIALFLFLSGFAFTANLTQVTPSHLPEASFRGMVYFIAVVLLFLSPLLTMRSLAEERRQGTLELLKTAPLSDRQIVWGKYLGVLLLVVVMIGLTVEFPLFLLVAGSPDPAPLILSYLGLLLLAASNCAAGLLASALTKNQMVAGILTFVFLLTLWFLPDALGPAAGAFSPIEHIESFSLGVFDLKDLFYYLAFIATFLLITEQVMGSER